MIPGVEGKTMFEIVSKELLAPEVRRLIVRGGATVILAMGDGKNAAAAIDRYLTE